MRGKSTTILKVRGVQTNRLLLLLLFVAIVVLIFGVAPFLPYGRHNISEIQSELDSLEMVVQMHEHVKRDSVSPTIDTGGVEASISAVAYYQDGSLLGAKDLCDVKTSEQGLVLFNGTHYISQQRIGLSNFNNTELHNFLENSTNTLLTTQWLNQPNKLPTLDQNGKLKQSQMPQLSVFDVIHCPDLACRNALVPREGMLCVVTNVNGYPESFVYDSESGWLQISDPNHEPGEENTLTSIGVGGESLVAGKVGVDLQIKSIDSVDGIITITNDAANKKLDLSISNGSIGQTQLVSGYTKDAANGVCGLNALGLVDNGKISSSSVIQYVGSLDHNLLLNYDASEHRVIDDVGAPSATTLWSSSKINSELGSHTHTLADITDSGSAASKNIGTTSGELLEIGASGVGANQILVSDSNSKMESEAKNSAHNKNFGSSAGTVAEGNHFHTTQIPNNRITSSSVVQHEGDLTIGGSQITASSITSTQMDSSYQRAAANGLATLGPDSKVPASQLSLDSLHFVGTWDASLNSPTLSTSSCTAGDFYICNVAGGTELGGYTDWKVKDWVVCQLTNTWTHVDNSENVVSVQGKVGVINIVAGDITSGSFQNSVISQSSVTQYNGALDHNSLLNYDVSEHRAIDDAGTPSATTLWSSSKINSELSGKASSFHTHGSAADKDVGTSSGELIEIGTNGVTLNQVLITNGVGKMESEAKNTAFNKNFGSTTGTVSEGDHTHTKSQIGLAEVQNIKVKLDATVSPSVNNDNTESYSIGSIWIDTVSNNEWVALDVTTKSAVWKLTTGGGGGGITWLGAWAISTSYSVDDAVSNGGESFICTSAHTSASGDEPGVGASWTSYWDRIAAKGTNGLQGDTGVQGSKGMVWDTNGWLTSTAYSVDDTLEHGGSSYICITGHTSGATDEPGVGGTWSTKWAIVAKQGDTGVQGTQGGQGDTGIQGTQGTQGDTGIQGVQGIQGLQGDTGVTGALTYQEITATADYSGSSGTYALITGMTVTPASGTYHVSFSASGSCASGGADVLYGIFGAGTILQHSERNSGWMGGGQTNDYEVSLHTQAVVTVNGSQTIEVHYKVMGSSHTMTFHERSIFLLKVA